ncbi:MAG: GldM family protein [Chitinophagaceae bacterium]
MNANAQVSIKNSTLIQPDSNVLFLGIENEIAISAPNNVKLTLISESVTEISSYSNNNFRITPLKFEPDILKVYAGKKLLYQKKYLVDTLAGSFVQLGGLDRDTATINEILSNRGLRCANKNKLFRIPFHVVAFYIAGIDSKADTLFQKIPADGNLISKEQEIAIRKLTKNCKLIFESIKVIAPGAKTRILDPIVITIK